MVKDDRDRVSELIVRIGHRIDDGLSRKLIRTEGSGCGGFKILVVEDGEIPEDEVWFYGSDNTRHVMRNIESISFHSKP